MDDKEDKDDYKYNANKREILLDIKQKYLLPKPTPMNTPVE